MPSRGAWIGVGIGVVVLAGVYLHERKAKQNAQLASSDLPGNIATLTSGEDAQGNFVVSQTINPASTTNPNDLMFSSALSSFNPYQNSTYLQSLAQEATISSQLQAIASGKPIPKPTPFPVGLPVAPNTPSGLNYPYPVGTPSIPGGPYILPPNYFNLGGFTPPGGLPISPLYTASIGGG